MGKISLGNHVIKVNVFPMGIDNEKYSQAINEATIRKGVDKILQEIRKVGINKDQAIEFWIEQQNWEFLLAAGEDYTDEEMSIVLPDGAYSIKVGVSISKARFNVDTVNEVRSLLKELLRN